MALKSLSFFLTFNPSISLSLSVTNAKAFAVVVLSLFGSTLLLVEFHSVVIRSCWFFTVLVCSLEWDVPYPAPLSPLCVCVYYTSVISLSFPSLSLSMFTVCLKQQVRIGGAVFLGLLQPPRRDQPDPVGFGQFYSLKKNKFYSLLYPVRKKQTQQLCACVCSEV